MDYKQFLRLDAQLREEYNTYCSDHQHIKYCYECLKSLYVMLRGDNKKSKKYNGDKTCLCCLASNKIFYVDIHQPIATATKCPYRMLLNKNYTIDKRLLPVDIFNP